MRYDAGAILGWKFHHAEGIKTVDGQIIDWPANLGTKPTKEQIDAWGVDYDKHLKDKENEKKDLLAARENAIKNAFKDIDQRKIILDIVKEISNA
jgi:hypothetical protein